MPGFYTLFHVAKDRHGEATDLDSTPNSKLGVWVLPHLYHGKFRGVLDDVNRAAPMLINLAKFSVMGQN